MTLFTINAEGKSLQIQKAISVPSHLAGTQIQYTSVHNHVSKYNLSRIAPHYTTKMGQDTPLLPLSNSTSCVSASNLLRLDNKTAAWEVLLCKNEQPSRGELGKGCKGHLPAVAS